MYSDIHQKHVAVRGLGVGDVLEYQVTLRTLKPEVPGQFWFEYTFEKNLIILDEQLDLDVPADKASHRGQCRHAAHGDHQPMAARFTTGPARIWRVLILTLRPSP